jgi:DNA repair exonuclease SbcCD ATPase subunit
MLQQMSDKVVAEGKKEQELFDKFMCYCTNGADELANSINSADTKIPQVESALKEAAANKAQFEADVKQHQTDRAAAKEAIAAATALREKQAAEYAKVSGDYNENIAAMDKAIKALSVSGAVGAFVQTTTATSVRRLAIDMDISPADRDQVMAFLAQGQGFGYAPKSGQIVGILQQMKETMERDLAEATAAEQKAIGIYDELIAAKEKEIDSNTAAIESKIERVGNLGVEIETMKADLGDTANAMIEDKKFLADLDKTCKTKQAEWDERCKVRNEELLALADTIKMLNDDDALELFKKTLPGASSFLQTKVTSEEVRKEALQALSGHHGVQLDLISLALRGKKVNFDKVIKMVDDMVALLKKEQQDDDDKKEMCEMQLDKAEDDLKVLETTISDLEKSLADGKEEIATLTDEIAALTKGLAELDKQVEEAMVNRKEENEDYQSLMANDGAALEIIGMAKNRLNKFYNPAMYKADAASFIQVHTHQADKEAPAPPPATWDAYSKKSEESNGVIAMMDSLAADLEKEMQEAELEEKDAQGDYEQFTRDAAEKRVQDSKSITEKDGAKAEAEVNLVKETKERQTKMKEALATVNYIEGLHKDCDWLLKNYDLRKEARAGESEALKKAKAVLSGADFSLVQTNSKFLRVRK